MPVSPDELLSRLKKGKPVPAILLLGEEPYLRDLCRAQLIDQYVAEAARTWALSRFSAERADIQAVLDQAKTLPMLSPQQVVFLEDAEAIEEFADKKRDDAVKQGSAMLGIEPEHSLERFQCFRARSAVGQNLKIGLRAQ